VAIVKARYTLSRGAAKATIRYIAHRPGKENARITRTLWGVNGKMERHDAYQLIDAAREGSVFFRFVISPDPVGEDAAKDLFLRDITERTMQALEERVRKQVSWVAATHADHAPHRHVHVLAVVDGRLTRDDLQALTRAATDASLTQRRERDQAHEATQREKERIAKEEAQWEQ
jgi:hypothetical protein